MSITLSLTHDCNLRCAYCYAGRKSRVAMSRETMRRAVEWAVDYHASQVSQSRGCLILVCAKIKRPRFWH